MNPQNQKQYDKMHNRRTAFLQRRTKKVPTPEVKEREDCGVRGPVGSSHSRPLISIL